jgi:GT2 family glycosyltransferase
MTDVGVAITTLDRPEALARCFESLRTQTTRAVEITVIDQSPLESARAVVEANADLGAHYIHQSRTGLGAGQNEAIRSTQAAVVAVLDDDCVAAPDWIATLARVFAQPDDVAAVGGRVLPLGPEDPHLYAVSSRTSTTPREFRGEGLPWDVGSGNNFAVRREWFDRVGGCDETLGPGTPARGAVDMDLFYRFLRSGAVVRYEPAALVYHERKSRAERLRRRTDYGFGTGAFIATWLRRRDRGAWRVLRAWVALRGRILLGDVRRGRWEGLREEALVLTSTARGLAWRLLTGN